LFHTNINTFIYLQTVPNNVRKTSQDYVKNIRMISERSENLQDTYPSLWLSIPFIAQ